MPTLPNLEQISAGGLEWEVEPAVRELVCDVLSSIGRGELAGDVVKENPARRVIRATTAVGELYVKSYRVRGPLERAKHVFVRSKALAELEAMRRLRAAGVATAEALAAGESRSLGVFLGASAFVSRAIPSARSFARELDSLRARGDADGRKRLIEGLASLAAAIARAGADHRDLHVGNVLLDEKGAATIIDLHAVSFPGELGAKRRKERLARLALSLVPAHEDRAAADTGREEVSWLASAAARLDPELGSAPGLERWLLERSDELLARHLASRDRRCLVDSKGFAVEGSRGRRVFRVREAPATEIEAALVAPALSVLHRHSRGRSVLELVKAQDRLARVAGSSELVRKREEYPGLRSRLGALLVGTRARCAWLAARALLVRGLPAPRAVALVEERTLGFLPRRSFLLMENLAGSTMVHVYLQEVLRDGRSPGAAPSRKRRELARALGKLVARLHARGIVHRDLAVQNVLLREKGESGFELAFVDLDEVRVRRASEREALRALVQLADLPAAASRSDKLRGLRAYLEEGGSPALARLVEREGERAAVAWISRALGERARA
ncbi:hypothetical protein HY251_05560, partial [bacterium]|nr:hypothetical protein [bacterium]